MIKKLIIDLNTQTVLDEHGNELGRTGDTKIEMDYDKALIYFSVNMILKAGDVRAALDKLKEKSERTVERAVRI
jgi:hypothetical protein